jgi:hypothetical protein
MKKEEEEIRPRKCYFAHPGRTKDTREEADIIKELESRRVIVHNPFEENIVVRKEFLESRPYKLARKIWINDFKAVVDSDMLLAYQPVGTAGTGAEIIWAYIHHKFIQIISPIKHPLFAYVLTGPNQQFESIEDWKHHKRMVWD